MYIHVLYKVCESNVNVIVSSHLHGKDWMCMSLYHQEAGGGGGGGGAQDSMLKT